MHSIAENENENVHKHEFLRFRTMTQDDIGPISKEGISVPLAGTRSGESIGVLTSGGDSQGLVIYLLFSQCILFNIS